MGRGGGGGGGSWGGGEEEKKKGGGMRTTLKDLYKILSRHQNLSTPSCESLSPFRNLSKFVLVERMSRGGRVGVGVVRGRTTQKDLGGRRKGRTIL